MKINDQMKAKLNLLKEDDIKPNSAELARQSGIDYRTIKPYYDGYEASQQPGISQANSIHTVI